MSDALGIGIRCEGPGKLTSVVGECAKSHALEFCDVSGFGELEWIDLGGRGKGGVKRLMGPFQLVSLRGRLRIVGDVLISDFMCTVTRETDNGIQMLGGILWEAELGYLELTFLPLVVSEIGMPAFDTQSYGKPEVSPNENSSSTTQTGQWREPGQAVPRSPATKDLDERWNLAIAESNRIRKTAGAKDDGDPPDERPELGDVVIHRQFGRCKVTRLGDTHITLRKPDSRNVQLGLTILKFSREEEDDQGRSVFSVTVRPRR